MPMAQAGVQPFYPRKAASLPGHLPSEGLLKDLAQLPGSWERGPVGLAGPGDEEAPGPGAAARDREGREARRRYTDTLWTWGVGREGAPTSRCADLG